MTILKELDEQVKANPILLYMKGSPDAPQCGFSTPGQVISAVALLNNNPRPTKAEAARAMSGNLCRCGAYEHYINGVLRASGQIA